MAVVAFQGDKSQCVGAHVLMTLLAEESHRATFRVNTGGATQGQGHWEVWLPGTINDLPHSPIQNSLEYGQHAWEAQSCIGVYSVVSWVGLFLQVCNVERLDNS